MSPDPLIADQLRLAEEQEFGAPVTGGNISTSSSSSSSTNPNPPPSAAPSGVAGSSTVEMAELLAENRTLRSQLQQSNDRESALRFELESTQFELANVSDAHKATAANFSRMSAEHVPVHQNLQEFQRQLEQELEALQLVIKQQGQEHADAVAELEDQHTAAVNEMASRHHGELKLARASSSPQAAGPNVVVGGQAGGGSSSSSSGGAKGRLSNKRATFNQLRRVRNPDPLISTPSGREAYQEMQHSKLKAGPESEELDRGLVEENAWLKEKLKAARVANRSIEGVNYDNSMEHITTEKQATGRWSAQREQDRKDQKLKKEILAYCREQGVPPESTDWLKMVCLWKHASECSDALANEKATIKRLRADLMSSRPSLPTQSQPASVLEGGPEKAKAQRAADAADVSAEGRTTQQAAQNQNLKETYERQLAEMRQAMTSVVADLDLVSSNFERLSSEHIDKHDGLVEFERQFTWETQSLQTSIARQQQHLALNDSASKVLVHELQAKVVALQLAGSQTEAALYQMETKLAKVQNGSDAGDADGQGGEYAVKGVKEDLELQHDRARLVQENSSLSARNDQLGNQLQDVSKSLREEKVARTAAEQNHLEALHGQLQKDGHVREQHALLVRQIEDDHQAESGRLKKMIAAASELSSNQGMLEAESAARQRDTFMQALGAKEEELVAVRLSFEEERETMAASLATELGPLSHALEGARAETSRERQRSERTETILRDQLEQLQSQLDQARGDANEAKAMFSEVSTDLELEREQQRHTMTSQTRAAERTVDEVRGQLQADHTREVRTLTNARSDALHQLSTVQNELQEALAAEQAARQEGEEALRKSRQDSDGQSSIYRTRVSQLEVQLREAISDKDRASTEAATRQSSAESDATKVEEQERGFKQSIADLKQRSEESEKLASRLSAAIQCTVSDCLQVGGRTSSDAGVAVSTTPGDPVQQLASLTSSLERQVQATARATASVELERQRAAGLAARVSELESDLTHARTNVAEIKDAAARSAADASHEQIKFTEILASVRTGFEKEKVNFEEQIEYARSQAAGTKAHLEEARAQLGANEEAFADSSVDLRTLAEEHARLEATFAHEKRHKATIESQLSELREEIARKARDLARCQADLGTAGQTIQTLERKKCELVASLAVSEGTVEQLQKALHVAQDVQEAAAVAENDMRLTLVQVEHDVIAAEADAKAVAISLKMETDAREVAQRDSDAAQKVAAELECEVALLEQQLQTSQVDSNLVSRLRQERNAAQLLLEEENVTRATQSTELREEIVKLQSKVRRQKRIGDGKFADVERQLTLSKQREGAANDNIRQLERITRQLREEAAKLQVEKDVLTLEKAAHQRAVLQADHTKRQNEMRLSNLRDENSSLKEDLQTKRNAKKRMLFGSVNNIGTRSVGPAGGAATSSVGGAGGVYNNVSVQLQQQAAVLKDLGNARDDLSTAASRESSRRLDTLQGQMRELDSSVTRRSISNAVPSSPLNASLSRSLMLADM